MDLKSKPINLKGCLEWTLYLMKLAGYWFPKSGQNIVIYSVYSLVIVNVTLITYICTEIAYVVQTFGQLEDMVDSLFVLLTHVMQCLKVLTFIAKKEKVYKLLDCLEDDAFQPKSTKQLENAMKIIKSTNTVAKVLTGLVISCCIFFGFSVLTESINGTKQLAIKASYPFETSTSPRYELISLYQIITLLTCGCANAAMDMVAAAFISQICVQLDLLSDTLIHIKDFALIELEKKNIDVVSSKLEDEMRSVFIGCVRHHIKIKEFAASVQSIFSFPLFAQFLTAVGTICLTLFEMSLVPKLSPYFGELILYQACMLTEIAIFCWYGNEVIYRNKKLAISLYNSEWMDCSEDYKKMVVFTMKNMQKELSVRVGNLVTFSLQTFLIVLKTAWSYYLVLDQIKEN